MFELGDRTQDSSSGVGSATVSLIETSECTDSKSVKAYKAGYYTNN